MYLQILKIVNSNNITIIIKSTTIKYINIYIYI